MTMQFYHSDIETPSALVLDIEIGNYADTYLPVKGKIDTGSDITVIPAYLASELKLDVLEMNEIMAVNRTVSECPTYFASIKIGHTVFSKLLVMSMQKEYALLGRDLINLWQLNIDGQNMAFTIEPWSTNPNDAK